MVATNVIPARPLSPRRASRPVPERSFVQPPNRCHLRPSSEDSSVTSPGRASDPEPSKKPEPLHRKPLILGALLLAAFAINLDTTLSYAIDGVEARAQVDWDGTREVPPPPQAPPPHRPLGLQAIARGPARRTSHVGLGLS
jgi:hypothetical protein